MPKRGMEDDDNVEDSQKAKRGRETLLRGVGESTFHPRSATQISILPPHGWAKRINIGSCHDELDTSILEKLPVLSTVAAASVYKYWTSAFVKAADIVELIKLVKLVEMYTFRSHVLNYELYKVLAIKVDELHSTIEGAKDIYALRAENKMICSRLAISEDAREKAEYMISMAEIIQKLSIKSRKQAELKLMVFEDMAHAKHKELTGALAELSKAKEFLAKLGVSSHVDLEGSVAT
ncbi:hypothetical protein Fot_41872 [Forsythia ovata]|uniref:Uncharacterized protein n=1 Tax=Forsythia ovata TaxID=205694 RepID=A0ABD1RJK5_9LAMI